MNRIRTALLTLPVLAASILVAPPASAETFDAEDLIPGVDRPTLEPRDGFGLPPLVPEGTPLAPAAWNFSVDTTVDAPDTNPGDGVCAADLDSAERCTLRAAVEEANMTKEVPLIWVRNLEGGYALELGALSIERPMSIRGVEMPAVSGQGRDRVFDISSGSSGFTSISGLTISDGYDVFRGGNIVVRNSSRVRLTSVVVTRGTSSVGGGIALIEDSTATIEDSTITGNQTEVRPRPRGSFGGGIGIEGSSDVVVRKSTISQNLATYGGGVFVQDGTFTVYDSTIEANEAEFYGGGVGVTGKSAATFRRTDIVENRAGVHASPGRLPNRHRVGGGIYVESPYVSIEDTTISGNEIVHPGDRFWAPDCYTLLADRGDFALTAFGTGNVIGDVGDECAVVSR